VTCSSADHVVVFAADTGERSSHVVQMGPMPTAMAIDPDLGRIFVRTVDKVVTLDAETLEPATEGSEVGQPLISGRTLALDTRRRYLYTPMDETHIAVTDAAHPGGAVRSPVSNPIETARVPSRMLFDDLHDPVFVSCVGDRVLQAISAVTGALLASTSTGGGARGLALSPNGLTLDVTCLEDSASLRISCSGVCLRRFIVGLSSLPIMGIRTGTTGGSDQGAQVSCSSGMRNLWYMPYTPWRPWTSEWRTEWADWMIESTIPRRLSPCIRRPIPWRSRCRSTTSTVAAGTSSPVARSSCWDPPIRTAPQTCRPRVGHRGS
jgi:hypothetical protein